MQTVHEYPESARQSEDVTVGTVWTETLAETTKLSHKVRVGSGTETVV